MWNGSLIRCLSLPIILTVSMLAMLLEAHARDYSFSKLQFPGAIQTIPYGINNRGEIVGRADNHGFVLERGVFTSIDVPFSDAIDTTAFGINSRGQIVGTYTGSGGLAHGFTLERGVFTPFDVSLPGVMQTGLKGINDEGQILGEYIDNSGGHSFIFEPKREEFIFLDDIPFPGAPNARHIIARGMNSQGQVVGHYTDSANRIHGFVLEGGLLSSIDVPFSGVTQTVAEGINDRGQIVGWYNDIFSTGPHGFVLSFREGKKFKRAVFTSFDVSFPEATATFGFGINTRGEIIGIYNDSAGEHGFVATPSKKHHDP